MTRSFNRTLLVVLLALLALAPLAPPAVAGQHQNANRYAHFTYGSARGFWNVDQELRIGQKASSSYWAQLWSWTNADYGGYLGLQTDGNRFDGSTGDTAIFSLWNANASSGPSCGTFAGEGVGHSCRLNFPINTNRWYRLRVWRLNADAGGQWWGAWIKDRSTGRDYHLGNLRVAATHTLIAGTSNFSEYYGQQVGCDAVPVSRVSWTQPAANQQQEGRYQHLSRFASASAGDCTGGAVREESFGTTRGATIELGGPRQPAPPPAPATNRLQPGQTLQPGQRLASPNGQYALVMQNDGNLVEYASGGRPVWASNTSGNAGTILINQSDGNVVLVAPGNRPIWSTRTSGNPGTVLVIQDDANLVAYAPGNRPVWASGTRVN